MKLVSWNIQWARGIDLAVDPARIVRTANKLADFDVLCLQEVAVNFPALSGSRGEDQVHELSLGLPGYSAHYGVATDVDDGQGGRSLFGNVLFSRLPVLQVYRHLLPWPADPAANSSMQRVAVEAVIAAPWGPIRIITTHLEYYSAPQRLAQVEALRAIHREACQRAAATQPGKAVQGPFQARARPASAVLAGDFNCGPGSPEYHRILESFEDVTTPDFIDAWTIAHPGKTHPPTAGLFENSWAKTPLCCDFVFVTADLNMRIRDVIVDANSKASDHQPVLVEFTNRR
jgi:endonuclease/exonuclease/phosphatase family metal-dependent hydrolase